MDKGYFRRLHVPALYAVYWSLTLLALLFTETRWGLALWPWPPVTAAVLFIIGETAGVARARHGDTFSEYIRKLYGGGVYRIPLILGMTVYIATAVWTAFMGEDAFYAWQAWRVGALCCGIGLWLAPHFLSSGHRG